MIYPFYVEVESSSRKNTVGVGGKSKYDTITTKIRQRDNGDITTPYLIEQRLIEVEGEQFLCTEVFYYGTSIHKHLTKY